MKVMSDVQKLKRWMEEYLLDRRLGEEVPGCGEGTEVEFSGEPPPADGQIRLWPARGDAGGPFYGLLLEAGYDRWRVLPFSPYAFPAVPEELRVMPDPPVRVVEGWNAREVTGRQAAESWCAGELPEAAGFGFQRWWGWVQSGAPLPGAPGDEVGPPVRHPLDPRHEYLEAERSRADLHLGESAAAHDAGARQRAAEREEEDYGDRE